MTLEELLAGVVECATEELLEEIVGLTLEELLVGVVE